jgi:hypothetical protein
MTIACIRTVARRATRQRGKADLGIAWSLWSSWDIGLGKNAPAPEGTGRICLVTALISDAEHWSTFPNQPEPVQRRMFAAEDLRRRALGLSAPEVPLGPMQGGLSFPLTFPVRFNAPGRAVIPLNPAHSVSSASAHVTAGGRTSAEGHAVFQSFPVDRGAIVDAVVTIAAVGYIIEHPSGAMLAFLLWLILLRANTRS